MTSTQEPVGRSGAVLDRTVETGDDRPSISEPLTRLIRVMQALKNQHASTGGAGGDVARERAAYVLLFPLVQLGPQRQGALADLVHADPSTVSRHVSLLVERGLVRRVPDARDGRVSRLVATDAGTAVLQEMRRERDELLARITSTWSSTDLTVFAELLQRFVRDLTHQFPALSLPDGPAPRPASTAEAAPSEEKDR
jgi:DNA-binding MarR family transcriptional regulator